MKFNAEMPFTKKSELLLQFTFLEWGKVDSNHRTHPRTDLQSVAIATMRLPQHFEERYPFGLTLQK